MSKHTIATLCFLLKREKILLGFKKRGFGMGKWNGVGGKVDADESPLIAAIRETREEIGVNVAGYIQEMGVIEFEYRTKTPEKVIVFVYVAKKWEGEPIETEEILPKWFDIDKVPYELMWPDDKLWLPRFIKGQKIHDSYVFDDAMQIIDYTIGH